MMNFSISTEHSAWFVPLCLIFAATISFLLYYKDKKLLELRHWQKYLLISLRFVALFAICFLLLSPLVKTISNSIQKPLIVIAADNSGSILITKDSAFYKSAFPKKYESMIERISQKYETVIYSFGEKVRQNKTLGFDEKQTDLASMFNEIDAKFTNRNVGAMLVLSDGIYNRGSNPVYATQNLNFPVYTVALGDTNAQKDILISEVRLNKIAFLGNKFPIEVRAEIKELDGAKTKLEVIHNKKTIFSKDIISKGKDYSETIDIELNAETIGIQHYTLKLSPVADEISTRNNTRDVVIDVVDSKQKVLILSLSPHPDVSAVRLALESNPNLEVVTTIIDKLTVNVKDFNAIILHQLPSVNNPATSLLSEIYKNGIPVLYILGSQTNLQSFNALKSGISITQQKRSFDDAQATVNKQFTLFEIDPALDFFLTDVPPLYVPFGRYQVGISSEVLFYQKVKGISTQLPLWMITSGMGDNSQKSAVILGEGIWRWRMYDFVQNSNHELFDGLMNKLVQYLTLQLKKENFVVNAKRIFNENEWIVFSAEVYNQSFEPVDNAEVSIEITNQAGIKSKFRFEPGTDKTKNYFVNVGNYAKGDYSYKAQATFGGKTFVKEGKFTVLPIDLEALNIRANHQLMAQLAALKNGKMFTPATMENFVGELDRLEAANEIVSINYTDKFMDDLINQKWLFVMLLLLVCTEWFLRKYWGSV
jgi:hypothetical protein